jgi:predicted transcriptional regulator
MNAVIPILENMKDSLSLFLVLSKPNTMKLFLASVQGVKISASTLSNLKLTRKKYYKALKQLKGVNLVEKSRGFYLPTTFGKIVYQRNIIELVQYRRYIEEMDAIDTIKAALTPQLEDKFARLFEKLILQSSAETSSTPTPTPGLVTSSKRVEVIYNIEDMISILLKRISSCKEQIIVGTRFSPEVVVNAILDKSRQGVNVKILADIDLIKEYIKLHNISGATLDSNDRDSSERLNVIANPWYPDKSVNRRICSLPFGIIIIDKKEVGIELVSSKTPDKFSMGILIKDSEVAAVMEQYYEEMWKNAVSDINKLRDNLFSSKPA